jgi:prolyl-tRNA synthetase
MRASQWFISTQKETPVDAEIISHRLMLRAGLIRKLGSGLYSWLPLGLKILRRVEGIVREEMNRSGAMEILMPAIQPAELWQETDRWKTFGGLLLTMKDSNGRDYCYGPTHEEVITDLMRQELHSYKQLPANFYQIQTKFRDEIRPRFGVMRAREFLMKDAYSFHLSETCLKKTYQVMYDAYCRIFTRLGLQFRAVEADTGAIGGAISHEFQVLAQSGEDQIFYSDNGQYAANIEQATSFMPTPVTEAPDQLMSLVSTPDKSSIHDISIFLNVDPKKTIKTLVVVGREHPLVALVVRGSDELNEVKAAKHPLVKSPLQFASEEAVMQSIGTPIGSLGPVELSIPVIVDCHAAAMSSFICGANKADYHYTHAAWGRDAKWTDTFDLRNVQEGDISPDGQGILKMCRGIEVGHVFQLGDKYAKSMQCQVLNDSGQKQTLIMGCYGIGISRVVAAAIEQHYDENGIIWPTAMAPFQIVIIPINGHRSAVVKEKAEAIYHVCLSAGLDVLIDDRNERPGVLFADNDLIGIPHRLVISERNLSEGKLEYKPRNRAESELINENDFMQILTQVLNGSQIEAQK